MITCYEHLKLLVVQDNVRILKKILPHACTSHVMNLAKKDCKKW